MSRYPARMECEIKIDWGNFFRYNIVISNPVASELLLTEIRRRQCRVPTIFGVGTRHVQSPPYYSGATRINMSSWIKLYSEPV